MKPETDLRTDSETLKRPASATLFHPHRYNLRSTGPPRYVQFSDQECPICLEVFSAPVIVNCGHSFCKTCIEVCMTTSRAVCPICKERLVKRLFLHNLEFSKHVVKTNAKNLARKTIAPEEPKSKLSTNKPKKPDRRTMA
uniref:RING-type domain-containing protein n=1 Tax=Anopheles minimus TaxID=112268 RepID=A0A182W0K2_9DIPT